MATAVKPNPIINFAAAQAQSQAQATAAKLNIVEQLNTINDASDTAMQAADDANEAATTISNEQEAWKATTDAAIAGARGAFGTDPAQASYRLAQLAQMQRESFDKANQMADVIHQKESATLTSDPLGWINARFTLPVDHATYSYYAQRHNNAEAEAQSILATTTAAGREAIQSQQTTSAAAAAAKLVQIDSATQRDKAQLATQNAQTNIVTTMQLSQLDDKQLNNAYLGVQVQSAQQMMAMHAQQMAESKARFDLLMQEKSDKVEQRQALQDEINQKVDFVNLAMQKYGGPTLTTQEITARLKKGDPALMQAAALGEQLFKVGDKAGIPVSNIGPAGAAAFYKTFNVKPTGLDAPTINFVVDQSQEATKDQRYGMAKDAQGKAEVINNVVQNKAAALMKGIKDGENNIYAAPPVDALTKLVPTIKNNSFVTGDLLPLAANAPNGALPDQLILETAKTALKANPQRFNEVAEGIAKYYSAAAIANNKLKAYSENGLPAQTGYNAKMPVGIIGNYTVTDLTKIEQVKRMLLLNTDAGTNLISPFNFAR